MMVVENWDVFTKRVLVEKYISGIMYENPESLSPLAPSADAHESSNFFHAKVTSNLYVHGRRQQRALAHWIFKEA